MPRVKRTEIAKGHSYISLFVDLKQRRTIHVCEGKSSDTVSDFTSHLEAQITFDKLHIMKLINEAVDKIRRAEAKVNPLLKGNRYTVLKNNENMTQKQKEAKESLAKLNLKTMRAIAMRETFQQLYSLPDLTSFEQGLQRWYFWETHSRMSPMIKIAKTIKQHWNGVLHWVESKINNGILEGLNSIVQAAKRKARDHKARHFKTMAFLLTGKLDFSEQNPYLPT